MATAVKPKWQKARIVKSDYDNPPLVGHELWVIAETPRERFTVDRDGKPFVADLVYEVNIEYPGKPAQTSVVHPDYVELLPEFADDVPLVRWEDWIKEKP